jgi:hypothetical protein
LKANISKVLFSLPNDSSKDEKETLDNLHGTVQCKELLCYLELMETTKPYMSQVTRVAALPVSLLFSKEGILVLIFVIISPDLRHLIVDNWLHIEFESVEDSGNILALAIWLRNSWMSVVDRQLKVIS